ncbi:hypothetical protein [Pseudomonas phage ZRG1]|nr:hypothetical protein [Pseudomonas phage ZRG1]
MKNRLTLTLAISAALLFSAAGAAHAGRCDGNNGNGKGNYCDPAPSNPPAETPAPTPNPAPVETDREYTARVHSYAHGNTLGIQHLSRRDAAQQVQIDGLGAGHASQQAQIDGLGAEVDLLSSRMGAEIRAVREEVREAREGSAIALAVAGQQFDTSAGFQVALSASTMAGEQAIAVGAGGAISERVFVNAAYAQSGRTRGGVVSSTFKF